MIMCSKEETTKVTVPSGLAPAVHAFIALSPANQELVSTMLRQLAGQEGITMSASGSRLPELSSGIPLWQSKLRQENYSSETMKTYLSSVTVFLRENGPEPSRLDIQKWLAKRLDTGSSARTATDRKALRSLFSFLHEEGLWPTDPTARLKSIKVSYEAKDPPTADEVKALLGYKCWRAVDTDKYQMMTLLLATTALRITEAVSLPKNRVYFSRHEIRIIGKGKKERVVPLVPVAEAGLKVYMEKHPNDTPYVFPGNTRTGWWSKESYEKTLKRACKKLGLKRFTPHGLRHFYATYTLQQGAKLEVVSRILGHASVGITADIYRHVMTGELHDTSRQFAPMQDTPMPKQLEAPAVEGEFKEVEDQGAEAA